MNVPPRDPGAEAPLLLFAGGGSGGHLSPGLAIAERLEDAARAAGAPAPRALFLCSDRAIDAHMLAAAGVDFVALPARPPSLCPRAALAFVRAFARSRRRTIDAIDADAAPVRALVALGGFAAAPAVAGARARNVPVVLLNLDAPPGRANRWIARRAERVWSAVPLPGHAGFAERVVGLPVRRAALAPDPPAACRTALGLDPDRPVLLVTGASQGATSLNRFGPAFAAARPDALARWQVLHLAGRGADDEVRAAYAAAGARAVVVEFLDAMGLAWGAADVAVTRAGANSVAEVRANAVPALFLPYPWHRDMHQRGNARPLVDAGAALLADDHVDAARNVADAGAALADLLADGARRAAMRERLRADACPDAADAIARLLVGLPAVAAV